MISQIGWIDFSPNERGAVKKFMDIMGMGGVIDELGVGMIRNAMSNKIFPGFSTLYTRAKYLFITPYILLDREKKQKKNQSGTDYFHNAEVDINRLIVQYFEQHPDKSKESFFGKEKKDGHLKRQPSEIYWNGMLRLHLVETSSSLEQLLSNKQSIMDELLSQHIGDETSIEQGEYRGTGEVNVSYNTNWQDTIISQGLSLTRVEAETLRDRLNKYTSDSLPAALISNEELWKLYNDSAKVNANRIENGFINFVEKAQNKIKNSNLRDNLIKAHDLSLFLHGAHIGYNIQLWTKAKASAEVVNEWRNIGIEWLGTLDERLINGKNGFDIASCFDDTNIHPFTKKYLTEMQKLVRSSTNWIKIEKILCEATEDQERRIKGDKSRFKKMEKQQVIKEMEKPQWIGLPLINYRYFSTRSIIDDIYQGLNSSQL